MRRVASSARPTTWVVLEDVLLQGQLDGEGLVAPTSGRVVAARLGLAKSTVARAFRQLVDDGLLV